MRIVGIFWKHSILWWLPLSQEIRRLKVETRLRGISLRRARHKYLPFVTPGWLSLLGSNSVIVHTNMMAPDKRSIRIKNGDGYLTLIILCLSFFFSWGKLYANQWIIHGLNCFGAHHFPTGDKYHQNEWLKCKNISRSTTRYGLVLEL